MKVIATKKGFDGRSLREPGEEFEMPDGAKGSWFKPVVESPSEQKSSGKTKGDSKDLV